MSRVAKAPESEPLQDAASPLFAGTPLKLGVSQTEDAGFFFILFPSQEAIRGAALTLRSLFG